MLRRIPGVTVFFLLVFFTMPVTGMSKTAAPPWAGVEWINLPNGEKTLDVADLKGKVIYLTFFQNW